MNPTQFIRMKKINALFVSIVLIIFALNLTSCSKARSYIGTYDGVTTTKGTVAIVIPGYIETNEDIPKENKNVNFVISKGNDNNKIVLKQTSGKSEDQFQAIGVVNKNTVDFLPFEMSVSYLGIKTDVTVLDMEGTLNDGQFTYSYSYSFGQNLAGYSMNIKMKACGTAEKQK